MEPDTLAYDGDAAAWEQWQVPPVQLPPIPTFTGSPPGKESCLARPSSPAVATRSPSFPPTLQYSEPPSRLFGDAGCNDVPPTLVYETQEVEPMAATLMYETQQFDLLGTQGANCDLGAFGPTLDYSDTTALGQVPPTLQYGADTFTADVGEVAPTLDYGGEDTLRPDLTIESPPKMSSLSPQAKFPARIPERPMLATAETMVMDDTPIFASDAIMTNIPATTPEVRRNSMPPPALPPHRARAEQKNEAESRSNQSPKPQQENMAQTASSSSSSSKPAREKPNNMSPRVPSTSSKSKPAPDNVSAVVPLVSAASSIRDKEVRSHTVSVPAARSSASDSKKRCRLRSKQPAPPCYAETLQSSLASPVEAGSQVLVRGDGWGSGAGEYLATVMETDDFTHTVIREYEDGQVEETHVLREHCQVVRRPPGAGSTKRARLSS